MLERICSRLFCGSVIPRGDGRGDGSGRGEGGENPHSCEDGGEGAKPRWVGTREGEVGQSQNGENASKGPFISHSG